MFALEELVENTRETKTSGFMGYNNVGLLTTTNILKWATSSTIKVQFSIHNEYLQLSSPVRSGWQNPLGMYHGLWRNRQTYILNTSIIKSSVLEQRVWSSRLGLGRQWRCMALHGGLMNEACLLDKSCKSSVCWCTHSCDTLQFNACSKTCCKQCTV